MKRLHVHVSVYDLSDRKNHLLLRKEQEELGGGSAGRAVGDILTTGESTVYGSDVVEGARAKLCCEPRAA